MLLCHYWGFNEPRLVHKPQQRPTMLFNRPDYPYNCSFSWGILTPSTTWFTWASSAPLNDFSHVCGAHPCNQHTATPRHLWNLQQQAASKQRMRVMRPDDVSQQTHTNCLTGLHWWGYFQLNHISRASVNTTAAVDHPPWCHSTKNKCQNTTNENPQHWLTGLTPSAFNS